MMKSFKLFILLLTFCLVGCSAMYGNEKQYGEGTWHFWANSREVARIKQDKLAFEKINSLPPQTETINGVFQGYKGIVANFSRHNTYNFHLSGPERKSFLVAPGQEVKDYLIPGNYSATIYLNGRIVGQPQAFQVSPRQHYFKGDWCHWYVTMK